MLLWALFRSSVTADDKPTPFHVHRELVFMMQTNVQSTREAAEFYVEHLADSHPHVRLKALLCMRHIALKVAPFRQFIRACASKIPPNEMLAFGCSPEATGLMHQARKNLLDVLNTDDATIETKNALLVSRCEGFGTRVVSFGADASSSSGNSSILANNPVSEFLAETVQEVADDFRSKGAVATLRDATIDVADLLVEGLEGLTGWMRQILPTPPIARQSGMSSTPSALGIAPTQAAVITPTHNFGAYRQQGGDQFAALFGEPRDTRSSLISLAQVVELNENSAEEADKETAPNTPKSPKLPALLLEDSNREVSFLD